VSSTFVIDSLELEAFVEAIEHQAATISLEARGVAHRYAGLVARQARRIVPVRTGRLRESIHVTPETEAGFAGVAQAGVVADAPYAGFVEFGTSRMSPRPFLGPALAMYRREYVAELGRVAASLGVRGAVSGMRERFSLPQQLVAGSYSGGG
jgi:HK97 gp10 family phage protein